jgi:hypothetical protein
MATIHHLPGNKILAKILGLKLVKIGILRDAFGGQD